MINPAAAIDCLRAANTDELYQTVMQPVRDACKGMVPAQFEDAMANGLLVKIAGRALAESLPKQWDSTEQLMLAIDHAARGLTLEFPSHFEVEGGQVKARRHG